MLNNLIHQVGHGRPGSIPESRDCTPSDCSINVHAKLEREGAQLSHIVTLSLPCCRDQDTPFRWKCLFAQLQHDIRHFDIFFRLVLDRHLEDDVLLMLRDRFLADRLHQLAESAIGSVYPITEWVPIVTYFRPIRSLSFLGG